MICKHYSRKSSKITITCGFRDEVAQSAAYARRASTVQWPDSKHNYSPSTAIDVVPYPVNWDDTERFYHFGGYVVATAKGMGLKVRWGGDWDGDLDLKDQNFNDLPHFELVL